MSSPARELVGAALAHLRSAPAVTALVGTRLWHRAPENAGYPHVASFDTDGLRDDATCIEVRDVTLNVHVWTRDGIDPLQDARSLADAVASALHGAALPLPGHSLITLDHRGERVFYDQDGLTGHGVVEFRAIIQSN